MSVIGDVNVSELESHLCCTNTSTFCMAWISGTKHLF